jgi:hypothetical protein
MSDRGCDYKTRIGTTYGLKVQREGDASAHGCDYKMRTGATYQLVGQIFQIMVPTTKQGQGRRTNWRWQCVRSRLRLQNMGRDDVHPGGGEGR